MTSEAPPRVSPALATGLVVLLLAVAGAGAWLLLHRPSGGPDLPRLGAAPAFDLVSESGPP